MNISPAVKTLLSLATILFVVSIYFFIFDVPGYDKLRNVSMMMAVSNAALALVMLIWSDEEENTDD